MNTYKRKNGFWFTFIELMIVVAIICLLASIVLGGGCSVSDGVRTGTITKFSNKGLTAATKSWEGEIILGGVRKNDNGGSVANVWDFSVEDSNLTVISNATFACENSYGVSVKYHQTLWRNPFARNTCYYVTSMVVMTNQ